MTDVLIAGGGPAGASLAILLGRAGYSVELHEIAVFPREKVCGEGLMPAGVAALSRLGVRVEGAPFRGIRYRHGSLTAEGRFPETRGLPSHGLGIRRFHLDQALFRAAASTPGVRAFEESAVEEPLVRGARVNGQKREARLLVAADGVHSRLRRQLGLDLPAANSRYGLRAHFRLAAGMEPPDCVEIHLGRGYEIYVTPLAQGELQVAVLAWRERARTAFRSTVESHRELAHWLDGAVQITEIKGVSPLAGKARARVVPGCVLLGDAAGFLDPITGGGMTQALLAAELLAGHLHDLSAFDRARERMLADYRHLTAMVLSASRQDRLFPLCLRLLRACPPLFSHAVGVSGGVRRLVPGVLR